MNETANTGLIIYATSNEAISVMISVIGRKNMNSPMSPSQNASGINGASVVSVPDNTGTNTSPAAAFAAFAIGTFPLLKTRCVFSITTMASSTTIPNANRNAKSTIMFMVKPMVGINRKARNIDKGTDMATNNALVAPMKNISSSVTRINPIMIVLIRSCSVTRVWFDWSPVMVI